ncbi:prophage protein [Secundilactobacillus pentosiphilus]|uniref:Prophage protein n=1 Tax=Secundilactobacillus pentosiphilus TaxID=1714682 RepID=A0A1Z5IUR1_9LACO|nr:hypothetical protein [Secundilactobacillus pentosiphilus]GAX05477.1 prophage protein [Secundilactobacillus pentosiphilus]
MRRFVACMRTNPFHTVIGLAELGLGIHLISHDQYFLWPPVIDGVANDDIVGGFFVLIGILMLFWVFDLHQSVRLDHAVLIASSFIMCVLTLYQFMHWVVLGIEMPWISNAALTAVIMILASRSDSE